MSNKAFFEIKCFDFGAAISSIFSVGDARGAMTKLRIIAFSMLFPLVAGASIRDPDGFIYKGKLICSHGNEVTAYKASDAPDCVHLTSTLKWVWRATLPFQVVPDQVNRNIEEDAQYCIIESIEKVGRRVVATDCSKKKYFIDLDTGKLKHQANPSKIRNR